ncbi:hypothetical protein [Halomarina ordinaria]|uniref:Uncharacterized protein n=1 Tax=Halomarina ordinaria TaxID=3033939 RepID=A0ABD5UET8_9EURY|nr:hypothetical protein [Halomarina sp. PSRA2]
MNPLSIVVLHGGGVYEITFLEYLLGVGSYLVAFGGLGGIVYWGFEAISPTHSEVTEPPDGREDDL